MKKLNELHIKAINAIIEGNLTMDEIASSVKKTRKTIYNWLKEPVFTAELEERRNQIDSLIKARLSKNALDGSKRLGKIINYGEDEKAVVSASSDALDRAGYPKLKQTDLNVHSDETAGVILIPKYEE